MREGFGYHGEHRRHGRDGAAGADRPGAADGRVPADGAAGPADGVGPADGAVGRGRDGPRHAAGRDAAGTAGAAGANAGGGSADAAALKLRVLTDPAYRLKLRLEHHEKVKAVQGEYAARHAKAKPGDRAGERTGDRAGDRIGERTSDGGDRDGDQGDRRGGDRTGDRANGRDDGWNGAQAGSRDGDRIGVHAYGRGGDRRGEVVPPWDPAPRPEHLSPESRESLDKPASRIAAREGRLETQGHKRAKPQRSWLPRAELVKAVTDTGLIVATTAVALGLVAAKWEAVAAAGASAVVSNVIDAHIRRKGRNGDRPEG